jgi:hypothetical protein
MKSASSLPFVRALSIAAALVALTACAASHEEARLAPLELAQAEPAPAAPKPAPLVVDHFVRDHSGSVTEEQLREILKAPVFLEEGARVGVVPVANGYGADGEVPVTGVTGALASALDASGQFEIVSEVSTDFPTTTSLAGLRELAARYRCDYLLLYRHRFVDDVHANGWSWTWATVVLPLVATPVNTIEADGVLEATLFDTKTGTILFTTFERAKGSVDQNVFGTERSQKELKEKMLEDTTKKLADGVIAQVTRLAAARHAYARDVKDGEAPKSAEVLR